MKIGIIGAGNLGTGLAKRLLAKRHSVVLSYSRGVSKLEIGTNTSAGEETAALVPTGQVVKAIPPFAEVLHSNSMDVGGARPGVFVCGNDESSCQIVASLVQDIGAEPVVAGKLVLSRYVEPANMLLVAMAYITGFGPRIALSLKRL